MNGIPMKKYAFAVFAATFVLAGTLAQPAAALSCLPIEDYLETLVGDDTVTIFSGTSVDRSDQTDYTREVIAVDSVLQGYAEDKVIVYHQKDMTWDYLCNNGPVKKGEKGVYITLRDDYGKYNVTQRLEPNDPLVTKLKSDLEDAEITGQKSDITTTDRINQIFTSIGELFKHINLLLKEYSYWKSNS